MASANQASNVTKYNAGGSGDNIIADGFVKSVEKVWLDSYTIAFTLTKTTVDIAVLPDNKKLTGLYVQIETTVTQTNGSLALGWSEDASFGGITPQSDVCHNLTVSTLFIPAIGTSGLGTTAAGVGGFSKTSALQATTTGTRTTITLQFNNWTMTSGTVKTYVSYT